MKLAGMLQGQGISLTIGKPGEGGSDEDIVVRIKTERAGVKARSPGTGELCFQPFGTRQKIAPKVSWGAGGWDSRSWGTRSGFPQQVFQRVWTEYSRARRHCTLNVSAKPYTTQDLSCSPPRTDHIRCFEKLMEIAARQGSEPSALPLGRCRASGATLRLER